MNSLRQIESDAAAALECGDMDRFDALMAERRRVAEERERAEWDAANAGERWDGQS